MVVETGEGMYLNRVETLGASENTEDDGVKLFGGFEQKATLHGAGRDFV